MLFQKNYVIIPEKPSKPHTPPIDRVNTPEPEQDNQPITAPNRTTYDDDFDDSKLPRVEFNEQACKTRYCLVARWGFIEYFRIESLVKRLYSGMPCTACGLRFLQSQTTRYADHLDFHYRNVSNWLKSRDWKILAFTASIQNFLKDKIEKKERVNCRQTDLGIIQVFIDNTAPPISSNIPIATEWLQYEEIEDAEQRAISAISAGGNGEDGTTEEAAEEEKATSTVPINKGDNKCAVCHEPFESFFHQDEEVRIFFALDNSVQAKIIFFSKEWHYKDCIIDEKTGKLMHVQCANDAENILEESILHRSDSIASVDETELKVQGL